MTKNELMNLNVLEKNSLSTNISGIDVLTKLLATLPNAIATPIQSYHEVEVMKELIEKALDQQTIERGQICDLIVELAKLNKLDATTFQMLMVAYSMQRF